MEVAARAIAGRRSKIAQESSDQRMSSAGEEQPTSQACLARFPLPLEGRRCLKVILAEVWVNTPIPQKSFLFFVPRRFT